MKLSESPYKEEVVFFIDRALQGSNMEARLGVKRTTNSVARSIYHSLKEKGLLREDK